MKKSHKVLALVEHYKILNHVAENYDRSFWIIPLTCFGLTGTLIAVSMEISSDYRWLVLGGLVVFSIGLLFQMINERAYQIENKKRIKSMRKLLKIDEKIKEKRKATWSLRWTKNVKAANVYIVFMFMIIILQILLLFFHKRILT